MTFSEMYRFYKSPQTIVGFAPRGTSRTSGLVNRPGSLFANVGGSVGRTQTKTQNCYKYLYVTELTELRKHKSSGCFEKHADRREDEVYCVYCHSSTMRRIFINP